MTQNLKIAFLWHQHQPDYFDDGIFIMPWVRLHAVKDYFDLPEILHEYPEIKQTFNIVPSMIKQIEMYLDGYKDEVQILTEKKAADLLPKDKKSILTLFFRCNKKNLIFPIARYKELYDKSLSPNAIDEFTEQDWLDLQVWYNLTWIGEYSKKNVVDLIRKERHFDEADKKRVLNEHQEILAKIVNQYKSLQNNGQIEISISPFYHPILPLLINSDVAAESQDYLQLPDPPFQFWQDANMQIKKGLEFGKDTFGKTAQGMWCSEGSISNDTLNLLIINNFKWTATDEKILLFSGSNLNETDKYFPYTFDGEKGQITIFFRDNHLSDKIGFTYQNMSAEDAVKDFIHNLDQIREKIIKKHGKKALDTAVVSVILDGENCWEYYKNNGLDFLKLLYSELSQNQFETVTFAETLNKQSSEHILNSVRAGSWINANFDIWIGSEQNKVAWELLTEARITLEYIKDTVSEEQYERAYEFLLKAEGSDWFWWYCPYHQADNESDFDRLFRKNLENAYIELGIEVPANVYSPIVPYNSDQSHFIQHSIQSESVEKDDLDTWAYYLPMPPTNSAMHKTGTLIKKIYYAILQKEFLIRIELSEELAEDEEILIDFEANAHIRIKKRAFCMEDLDISECILINHGNIIQIEIMPIIKQENMKFTLSTVIPNNITINQEFSFIL